MGYVGLIRNLVFQALTQGGYLRDIPVAIIVYSGALGDISVYDPITQTFTLNDTIAREVSAVYDEPKEEQIDNQNVLRTDRFFYISDVDLEQEGVTELRVNDRIVQNGIIYNIIKATTDPTGSLWTVFARLP
jgi:hypothetical protein